MKGAVLELIEALETLRQTREDLLDEIVASEENLKKAKERLEKAKKDLRDFDETLKGIHNPGESISEISPEEALIKNLRRPIEDLDLHAATRNALTREPWSTDEKSQKAVKYIGDLVILQDFEVKRYRNIGPSGIRTIETKLRVLYNLHLGMTDLPNWREGLEETNSP